VIRWWRHQHLLSLRPVSLPICNMGEATARKGFCEAKEELDVKQ
jgi:hypothetical protein